MVYVIHVLLTACEQDQDGTEFLCPSTGVFHYTQDGTVSLHNSVHFIVLALLVICIAHRISGHLISAILPLVHPR